MTTTYPIGGVDWVAVQKTLQNYVVAATGLAANQVVWQQQDTSRRPPAPAVELKLSNIAETGRTWADEVPNPLVFADITITAVDTGANTLAATAHGLLTGDGPVQFTTTGTLPAPLLADTDYWIVAPDADHLQVATSYVNTGGGQGSTNPITTIDLTSAGSGTIRVVDTVDTLRAGQELLVIARGLLNVTLELHCHTGPGVGMDMATSILHRVRSRREWPSLRQMLLAPAQGPKIGMIDVERVRAILGTKDAVLFEPRAYLDIHLCVPSEEAEFETIIETAEVTDLANKTTVISVG